MIESVGWRGGGARAAIGGTRTEEGQNMLDAVIFDMDGTLVDSERLGFKAWEMVGERDGVPIPRDLYVSFVGRAYPPVIELLADYLGSEERARWAYDRHVEHEHELARTDLRAMPGAREVLESLSEDGYRLGLATSSRRATVEERLGRLGMLDFFESVTCGPEAEHSKPHPAIYLLAAERMGARPGACAVVEDSPNGVRSGHAAGMHVFMVPDMIDPTDEIERACEAVLPNLASLPGALAVLEERAY